MTTDYSMSNKIRNWYKDLYSEDEMAAGIPESLTFNDFLERLGGENAYSILNVSDSIVRERVFHAVAEMSGTSYEELWNRHGKAMEEDPDYRKMMEKAEKAVREKAEKPAAGQQSIKMRKRTMSMEYRKALFMDKVETDKELRESFERIKDSHLFDVLEDNPKYQNRLNLSRFLTVYNYSGSNKRYDSPVENEKNREWIDKCFSKEAQENFIKEIENIKDRLSSLFDEEEKYIKEAAVADIAYISKDRRSNINIVTCRIDADMRILSVIEKNAFAWEDRGKITDYLLEINKKHGITQHIAEDYQLTARAKKTYSAYRADKERTA